MKYNSQNLIKKIVFCGLLNQQGKLYGKVRPYPLEVYYKRETHTVKGQGELYDLIEKVFIEKKEIKKDVKLEQVLDSMLFFDEIDTAQLTDERTSEIISMYEYYKDDPSRAFIDPPDIWFESVNLLRKTEPRLF
ncbi:MAG: hypothetical protein IPJ03_17470 [Ignavibacteriales bacterium]|nr:hypothetical protein [Ignavibacteriales bacterium]